MGGPVKSTQIATVACCLFLLVGAMKFQTLDSQYGDRDNVFEMPLAPKSGNRCELLSNNVTINCSKRGLSSIPKTIPFKCKDGKCIKVDLSGNRIAVIADHAFRDWPRIEIIDLSLNNLTTISRRAFDGLDSLKLLRLNNNSLSYDTLVIEMFKPLTSLETLFIENQVLQWRNMKYPSQILRALGNLKKLSIDFVYNESIARGLSEESTRVTKFDEEFEAAKSLSKLVLFAPGENQLFVPGDMFQHVSNITELSLRSCRISEMENTVLSRFTRLQSLDLGRNKKLSLNASINLLRLLKSPVTHIDLEFVNHFLNPVKLTKEMTSVFKHLPVQNLSLAEDHITSIEANNLSVNWSHLRTLYIGKNDLVSSGEETNLHKLALNFGRMRNLTLLDISYWQVNSVSDTHDATTEGVTCYGPSHIKEPLQEITDGLINDVHDVDSFKVAGGEKGHRKISFPKNLESIILRGTFRPGNYIFYLDCFPNKVNCVDFSHSNFKNWPVHGYPYPCLNSLQVLNAGYNDFTAITADRYKAFPALKKLILAGNKLYIMLRDRKTKHFRYLNNLTHLDLAYNSIVNELYPETFNDLPAIKEVILRGNRLISVTSFKQDSVEYIDFSNNFIENPYMNITGMPSLKNISFAKNNVRFVSENVLHLWHGKNISVDFSQNPFNCSSCLFLPFLRWFNNVSSESRTVTLLNSDHYRCGDEKKTYVRKISLDALTQKCTSFAWMIISIAMSICVALCITLGSVLYRHRWTISFWINFAARKSHSYSPHMRQRFQYDAFVIYSSEDRHWVHDVLRTRLEDESDIGLCIHYRNFLPGRDIEENVLNAIENSRHSMLVVSRHFLKSEWCIFEMHVARNVLRQQRKDVLVLILLEDIPVQDAPLTLVNMLRTRTYLKWPANDAVGQEAFWEMLKETLTQEPEVAD